VKRMKSGSVRSKRLVRELSAAVERIPRSTAVRSEAEGETYICSVCEAPRRICRPSDKSFCAGKMKDGTEMQLLEESLASPVPAHMNCMVCGTKLSKKELRADPMAEICGHCRGTVVHLNSK
jgi:hypothetical protein